MTTLTDEQLERYSRHIVMEELGLEKQTRITESKVLIIGLGGLGSPVAYYLAAAGVGEIGVMDNDTVDLSNLQRQIIHTMADLDRPKVDSAAEKIAALNPTVKIHKHDAGILPENAIEIIKEYDFVVSCTDNFESKYLINDACVLAKVPFCHSGVVRCLGQVITVIPRETACFRCLFSDPPPKGSMPSPAESGVLGSAAGLMGTIQATEAVKYLAGTGGLILNTLLTVDAMNMDFQKIEIKRNANCPVCGESPSITSIPQPGIQYNTT